MRPLISAIFAACLLLLACRQTPLRPPAAFDRSALLHPQTCGTCHAAHFAQWAGSMHAYAAEDPVFLAMNARGQRDTGGALGSFCVNCHAPLAVREGATVDGLNLAQVPQQLRGVTCYYCHNVDQVTGTHNNPLHLRNDTTMLGSLGDPVANAGHPSAYSPHLDRQNSASSAACGSCHDIQNDHGVDVERTFAEFRASVFAAPQGGNTCAQCHMAEAPQAQPLANLPDLPPRKIHDHRFPGVDVALTPFVDDANGRAAVQEFLDSSLQAALCVRSSGNQLAIRVILDNVAAGHAFPSGASHDRRLWTEVTAQVGGQTIYETGVRSADASPLDPNDGDLWVLRECLFDDRGQPVNMSWQASSWQSNALPALATFNPADPRFYQTHVVQKFPRDAGRNLPLPDTVTLRLRLQPIGLDVLDDLIASGDLDPNVRARMPTFQVGAPLVWTPQSARLTYRESSSGLFYSCVSAANFNAAADTVPAAANAGCQ